MFPRLQALRQSNFAGVLQTFLGCKLAPFAFRPLTCRVDL